MCTAAIAGVMPGVQVARLQPLSQCGAENANIQEETHKGEREKGKKKTTPQEILQSKIWDRHMVHSGKHELCDRSTQQVAYWPADIPTEMPVKSA